MNQNTTIDNLNVLNNYLGILAMIGILITILLAIFVVAALVSMFKFNRLETKLEASLITVNNITEKINKIDTELTAADVSISKCLQTSYECLKAVKTGVFIEEQPNKGE